ncbi:MAG: RIP metalloprotease RseP [Rhodobacteraceae bacterium]|nr:RIP metalloprotease RseP [Paracoccaceae bacterium]
MDIFTIIPQVGGFFYTLVTFVVALSVIVAVHEYGHYIVGRWTGIHAEVFSIGFGPVLWSRPDKHGTVWQIAALPFGGYVKFLGDANAASGKDADAMDEMAEQDPAELRRTMHGAPLWARSATVAAGPIFNFIMSILIFTGVLMATGVARDPLTVDQLHVLPGGSYGLASGDEVLAINDIEIPGKDDGAGWAALTDAIPNDPAMTYDVRRDGQEMTVKGPNYFPPYISFVALNSAAMEIELQQGDVITGVNGTEIFAFNQLKTIVEASNGAPLQLTIWRAGETLEVTLVPRRTDEPLADGGFATNWRIGIGGGLAFSSATEAANLGDALIGGVARTYGIVVSSLSGLKHMITGAISSCNMSGPLGIAKASGATASQGLTSFIMFIAFLSTAVGLLNLFPIPILDGGHLVFHAYEAVTGKPPSDKALRVLMTTGLVLILSLMVFALSNDIFC